MHNSFYWKALDICGLLEIHGINSLESPAIFWNISENRQTAETGVSRETSETCEE